MEAKTTIKIHREDLVALLNANGYGVPDDAQFYIQEYDYTTPIALPLCVDVPAAVAPRAQVAPIGVGPTGLDGVPGEIIDVIRGHVIKGNRISAIKEIRTAANWTLKDAKAWLDKWFPALPRHPYD